MKGTVSMYCMFDLAARSLTVVLLLLTGEAPTAGPKLVCDEPSYNFGEREEGETVEHTFIIKNVGDAPADMNKLKPQCGCAVLNPVEKELAPGAETAVTLKMSLGNQRGPVHKNLTILSDDEGKDSLKLTLEGAVTSSLYVIPERLELGNVDAEQGITRSVIVAFAQEQPVKITKTTSDADTVVSEVKTLREGGLYRVTVRVNPGKVSSRVEARVFLHTDWAKYPIVGIPVSGNVVGDLAANPSEIVLAGDPEQSVVRYVAIRSPKGKRFEIEQVQCPTPSVEAGVKPMGSNGYLLEISGLMASPDLDGKSVVVTTSLGSIPEVRIPLHVRRPPAAEAEAQVPPSPGAQPVTQVPPSPGAQPVRDAAFRLEQQSVDRGEVRMGKPLEHAFRLLNTSNETRHILKVTPGCSCAKVIRFSKEVAPQSWGEVAVALETIGSPGLRQSSVLIETDDPEVPRLNPLLTCQVAPAVEAIPAQLVFVCQGAAGFPVQAIEVAGLYEDEKIALGEILTSDPMISVTKETIDEHRRFRLNISVNKKMPAGFTLAHLVIPLKGSAQKSVWFPMTVANQVELEAEPSGLELFLEGPASQTAEFTVKRLDNSFLEVNSVELDGTVVQAVLQRTADNAVRVRLQGLKVTHAPDTKHVRVLTNHGELRVPVSVQVRPSRSVPVPNPSSSPAAVPKT